MDSLAGDSRCMNMVISGFSDVVCVRVCMCVCGWMCACEYVCAL